MARLVLIALLAGAFTLATYLEPAFRRWSNRPRQPQGVVAALMGDSRRLFANQFFIQSDVYLHGGFYPSIFDQSSRVHSEGESEHEHHESGHQHDSGFKDDPAEREAHFNKPRNWLDAFGRHFYPTEHRHPGDGATKAEEAREILPWLKLAAEMDPQRVETYTVASYWLRQMDRGNEAIRFLREGMRANPGNYEILFELGACYEDRKDIQRARNLWELAWRRWQDEEAGSKEPERLMAAQILSRLARLEIRDGQRDRCVHYLERLKAYSARPQEVEKRIGEVKAGLPLEADTGRQKSQK